MTPKQLKSAPDKELQALYSSLPTHAKLTRQIRKELTRRDWADFKKRGVALANMPEEEEKGTC